MPASRQVRPEEVIAEAFLRATSGDAVVTRPQERVAAPDLLIGDGVAVEVRPLAPARGGLGFEEVRKPTIAALRRSIGEHNRGRSKATLALTLRPVRPMPAEESLRLELDQALRELRARGREAVVTLPCGVTLEATRVQHRDGIAFTYAGTFDLEGTGMVVGAYVEAIRRCLGATHAAAVKVKERYPTCWLLMVDLIDCPLNHDEVTAIGHELGPIPLFDRVMLVHPTNGLLLRLG